MAKYPILERPKGKNTVRVVGNVYADVSADDFVDEFMEWLESRGYTFFGHMVDLDADEDDDAIFEILLGDGSKKGIAIVPDDKNAED